MAAHLLSLARGEDDRPVETAHQSIDAAAAATMSKTTVAVFMVVGQTSAARASANEAPCSIIVL